MMRLNADVRGLVHLGRMSGGYFFTTFINNAIPILFLPVLTRYLSPAEYANIALFGFFLAISNSLTGISIPAVISKNFFDQPREFIKKIIGNSIMIVLGFSLVIEALILLTYPLLHDVLDLPLFWLMIIPPASFAFIVFSMGLNVLRNNRNVLSFSCHQIGNTVMNLLISLLLVVVLLWGWRGRVLGIILALLLSGAWSFYYLQANGYVSFALSKDITRRILKVVLPLIPNSFQSVMISQMGIFFVQYFYTKKLLGIYSVGFQIALAVKLLIDTLGLSWSPFLYQQLAKAKDINRLYLTRMLYALLGIVLLGVILINIFSGIILKVMTGPEFHGAREFIPWLTIGLFFQGIYVFLMPILIKHEKQNYISAVSFLNMFILIALNFGLIRLFGYMGVAYAYCTTYFLMFLALAWQSHKVLPLPWLKALKIWSGH